MAAVVFALENAKELYVADLEAGTVTKLDAPTGQLPTSQRLPPAAQP